MALDLKASPSIETDAIHKPAQVRPLLELGVGYALILATIWTPRPYQRWMYCSAVAFVQQFLLQGYFLFRLLRLLPRREWAALAAAGMFAIAHLPNPILTPVTFIWGACACFVFLRCRNVFPLAIAHALLGITVAITIPGPVVRNMRVGLGYLRYHATVSHPPWLERSPVNR